MNISDEELAAFADGELDAHDAGRVAAAIEADPELARRVDQHRALRAKLGAHFAPVLDQEVPDRLSDLLKPQDNVVHFAAAREAVETLSKARRTFSRWGWIAAPALAACLVLAMFLPQTREAPEGYADGALAAALDNQLVAEQGNDPATRILVSFQRVNGEFCRAFTSPDQGGIACRDTTGWALIEQVDGTPVSGTAFRQAGNKQAALLAVAQEMAVDGALDAQGEREARDNGWRN